MGKRWQTYFDNDHDPRRQIESALQSLGSSRAERPLAANLPETLPSLRTKFKEPLLIGLLCHFW